jgi:hypothetical protein
MSKLQKDLQKSTLSFTEDYTISHIEVHFHHVDFHVCNDVQSDVVSYDLWKVYEVAKDYLEEVDPELARLVQSENIIDVAFAAYDQVYNDLLVQNTRMRTVHPNEFLKWDTRKQYNYVESWRTHVEKFGENPPNYIAAILTQRTDVHPNYKELTEAQNGQLYVWMQYYNQMRKIEAA